jgi:hypothetical protein
MRSVVPDFADLEAHCRKAYCPSPHVFSKRPSTFELTIQRERREWHGLGVGSCRVTDHERAGLPHAIIVNLKRDVGSVSEGRDQGIVM